VIYDVDKSVDKLGPEIDSDVDQLLRNSILANQTLDQVNQTKRLKYSSQNKSKTPGTVSFEKQ
jgi:hypothetical protein